MDRYTVEKIEPVAVDGPASLAECQLMSPFVWRGREGGGLSMLVRAVSQEHAKTGKGASGVIWYATGATDGLNFTSWREPLLVPGPDSIDIGGCEDPTLVATDEDCIVYYTGLDRTGEAQLLYAQGRDVGCLRKVGIAHASNRTERNTKEATVERTMAGDWRLLFEYSRDERSRIGLAIGEGPAGPWREQSDPLIARDGKWDCWHLSTGPMLMDEPGGPLMFYNGADQDASWGIGWVQLTQECHHAKSRSDEPLIGPQRGTKGDREINFAASAVGRDDAIWLYFTRNDQALFRATIRRRPDWTGQD